MDREECFSEIVTLDRGTVSEAQKVKAQEELLRRTISLEFDHPIITCVFPDEAFKYVTYLTHR